MDKRDLLKRAVDGEELDAIGLLKAANGQGDELCGAVGADSTLDYALADYKKAQEALIQAKDGDDLDALNEAVRDAAVKVINAADVGIALAIPMVLNLKSTMELLAAEHNIELPSDEDDAGGDA